jgi:hypothetical protein
VPQQLRRRRIRPRNRNRGLLGSVLSSGVGKLVTKGLGTLISGFGDYKVQSNTLMTGGLDPPTVVNSIDQGGVIVRHREYLQDISATIAFTINNFSLNPGIVSTFPWLSSIAQHFEQYRFRGVLFEFKTLSSDTVLSSATSSALGSVIMATQYNALSPAFPDKFTMENYEFANSSKPSNSFIHPVECQRGQTSISELYVRGEAAPANSDIRLYDMGVFSIATVGMQAASGVAGELWVTYELELYKPKISNPINLSVPFDHFRMTASGTNTNPFLNNVASTFNTLGGVLTGHIYTFPANVSDGVYILVWVVTGSSTLVMGSTLTLTGCVGNNLFLNDSQSTYRTAGTTTIYFDMAAVTVTAASATVSYGTMTLPATITSGDFFVLTVASNVTFDSMEIDQPENNDDEYERLLRLVKDMMSSR